MIQKKTVFYACGPNQDFNTSYIDFIQRWLSALRGDRAVGRIINTEPELEDSFDDDEFFEDNTTLDPKQVAIAIAAIQAAEELDDELN